MSASVGLLKMLRKCLEGAILKSPSQTQYYSTQFTQGENNRTKLRIPFVNKCCPGTWWKISFKAKQKTINRSFWDQLSCKAFILDGLSLSAWNVIIHKRTQKSKLLWDWAEDWLYSSCTCCWHLNWRLAACFPGTHSVAIYCLCGKSAQSQRLREVFFSKSC